MEKGKIKSRAVKTKVKGRVLVALSGGVDSAVAAQLLKNQGYEIAGVFLHFWKEPGSETAENRCCSLAAARDAQAVADKIGCHLYSFNFVEPFKAAVVDNFLSEYAAGRTPNPCIQCNKAVKLGRLLQYAKGLGYDYVATGHYAKIARDGRTLKLRRGRDRQKDQSYFLYTFTPDELKHLRFPLGSYNKKQVRALAAKFGLPVAAKPESQDICFIRGDHNDFLKKYLALKPGEIRLLGTNEKVGRHEGLPLYTLGQRRGLGGGGGPYYAAQFDYKKNILYVVKDWSDPIFYSDCLIAESVNWLSGRPPRRTVKCSAVIRYGAPAAPCRVSPAVLRVKKNQKTPAVPTVYQVEFLKPQRTVTPGQSVVFYNGDQVLGGGIIASALS